MIVGALLKEGGEAAVTCRTRYVGWFAYLYNAIPDGIGAGRAGVVAWCLCFGGTGLRGIGSPGSDTAQGEGEEG